MRFSVEAWDPGYGSSADLDQDLEDSTASCDVSVELPAGQWRPLDPRPDVAWPSALLFVDGVRRVDARVWIHATLNGSASPDIASVGLCASYAAGVLCCCQDGAHLLRTESRRGLFTIDTATVDIPTNAGNYAAHRAAPSTTPVSATLSQLLQRRMGDLEAATALDARSLLGANGEAADTDLLVVDGPLWGRQHLPRTIGYIKSHRSTYLPEDPNRLVATLAPGQRTPVFMIGTSWERHSWYLRLPGPAGPPWAGVVRIEAPAHTSAADAITLASLSQRCLPRFASTEYKDPRAPQNLYPIAGLERQLRRRLGDSRLLYRALRQASAT